MDIQQNQVKEKAWEMFCEDSPEFGDPKTREHKLMHETYNEQFKERVDSGGLPYPEALESAREEVSRRLALENIRKCRSALYSD